MHVDFLTTMDGSVVLAVSGGVDSMVLLHLFLEHHPHDRLIVAHFDHALRGAESDGDREFITDVCREKNIRFTSQKLDIATLASEEKTSIEETARRYRYKFLTSVAIEHEAKYILTGHHQDDRIETAIFNLIRGSKLGGIHALSPLSEIHPGVMIFRPLLDISKTEILSYARDHSIKYREDSTNLSTEYQRNYLRHELLPKFEVINPRYRKTLTRFIEYTEDMKDWIDSEVVKFLAGNTSFRVDAFEEKPLFFQKEIVRYLFEQANQGTVGLSEGNMDEMLRFITSAHGGTEKSMFKLHLSKQKHIIQVQFLHS